MVRPVANCADQRVVIAIIVLSVSARHVYLVEQHNLFTL